MKDSYIPKFGKNELCDGLELCGVRKDKNGVNKIYVKNLDGNSYEENLEDIINACSFNGKTIIRVYSSGHIFLSDDNKKVFLISTEKNGIIQHQFTGGSPLENENKEVFFRKNGTYKIEEKKIKNNARIRTKNRTGVDVLEEYTEKPLVDWVLIEQNENGKNFYKLVCLFHFIVKKYDGVLGFTGEENTIEGKIYNIDDLLATQYVAPNIYIMCKEAQEFLSNLEK